MSSRSSIQLGRRPATGHDCRTGWSLAPIRRRSWTRLRRQLRPGRAASSALHEGRRRSGTSGSAREHPGVEWHRHRNLADAARPWARDRPAAACTRDPGQPRPARPVVGSRRHGARGRAIEARRSTASRRETRHIFNLGHGMRAGDADRPCRAPGRAGEGSALMQPETRAPLVRMATGLAVAAALEVVLFLWAPSSLYLWLKALHHHRGRRLDGRDCSTCPA
jgi:hypothetical protein